ncbi:MAG: UDP-3-O-(3-hydroxymyristoyl)glucosamine N-acyltransferase [Candidatus Omnitrophica bacterium]|nr:UDP-3-O-(3-hydroxymyristoyl)glucosamine N-acyltransferase [Candidatus Omnitrophota bacterium]
MRTTVEEVACLVEGELVGDGRVEVSSIKAINEAGPGDLAFILHPKYADLLRDAKAACAIVPRDITSAHIPIIRVKNPSLAFKKIVDFVMAGKVPHPKGIHPTAVISDKAQLGNDVGIGAYAVIDAGTVIGNRTVIYPFTYIGHGCTIGEDSVIYTHVSIRENITIGSRVIIHSGTVIGADGFGYESSSGVHLKIPQIGDVIIEDDVEIGASVTIDRAKFAHTKIGTGTKIDNLVQIAHNVEIGPHCIVVAQCGISGSTVLGHHVILAGQAGLVDHIKIGDESIIAAQSGVSKSVPAKSVMFGSPARPIQEERRLIVLTGKLPEIYERLKTIEKKLNIDIH